MFTYVGIVLYNMGDMIMMKKQYGMCCLQYEHVKLTNLEKGIILKLHLCGYNRIYIIQWLF